MLWSVGRCQRPKGAVACQSMGVMKVSGAWLAATQGTHHAQAARGLLLLPRDGDRKQMGGGGNENAATRADDKTQCQRVPERTEKDAGLARMSRLSRRVVC